MSNLLCPVPNQLIGEEYQLLKPCGEGRFSTVWQVLRLRDEALVALKILKHQDDMEGLLDNEAGPLVGVMHLRLTGVIKAGHVDGFYFIEMEYCDGPTLEKIVSKPSYGESYSLEDAVNWIIGVLEGLDFMHSRRVTHGDIKPGNILLDLTTGDIKITDFGASRYMKEDVYWMQTVAATWAYQAPETMVLRERRFASDIYSVGATLFQLSTGRLPYLTIPELVYRSPVPLPRALNRHIPEALEAVILKALDESPQNRYQNPPAMITDLQKCLVLLRADLKPAKRTREERENLRLFACLANELDYQYSDIAAQEQKASDSSALIEEDKEILSSFEEDDLKSGAGSVSESGEVLSLFADLAYRLGYENTAISAYQELLSQIEKGTIKLDLREVLYRLEQLYARQKRLPK